MHRADSSDRGVPTLVAVETSAALFSAHVADAEAAAARLEAALEGAPLAIVLALDRALRDGGLHRARGVGFAAVEVRDLENVERLPPRQRRLALVVATCLRSGFVRAAALDRLAREFDPLCAAAALVRLTDFVRVIADNARRILEAHLRPNAAPILVRTLPLCERLGDRWRASPIFSRIPDLLRQPSPLCERALWEAARDDHEPGLTRAACRLLARRFAGDPTLPEVYALALSASSPLTRRWAAEAIVAPRQTPPEIRRRFLKKLADDRAPAIRLLAVQAWAREADGEAHVAAAAFDGNAEVRHRARVYLARRGAAIDYRARARETLESGEGTTTATATAATI
ncbi:MAG: hypothetical protein KC486_30460, partial [Myxococcales bacterium]|nr:hypothetical protein [Myxococcales bacterium]